MALTTVLNVEEFEEIDETTQALYKQNQAKDAWILDIDGVQNHPTVKGLAGTLAKFREVAPDARAMKVIKENYEALKETWADHDPEDLETKLARLEELEAGTGGEDAQARIDAAVAAIDGAWVSIVGIERGTCRTRA